jgi:hypothetical protein
MWEYELDCQAERILDKVTHETTATSAHRPSPFTAHDYNTTISDFQILIRIKDAP